MAGDEIEGLGFETITAVEMRENQDLAYVVHGDGVGQIRFANSFYRVDVVFVRHRKDAEERIVSSIIGEPEDKRKQNEDDMIK